MTRQEMRQMAHRKRKEIVAKKEEETLIDKVKKRQKEILDDPYRRKWNKYNCWNYRTIEGIEEDIKSGWKFEVRAGRIYSINNPKVDAIKDGIEKISLEEYEKIAAEEKKKGGVITNV